MPSYVLGFADVDRTKLVEVGGKGANLGELARIEGITVPDGFCISTEAFKRIVGESPAIDELLEQLALLTLADRDKIAALSAAMRRVIEGLAVPDDIAAEIDRLLARLGENDAYAVRSSATAEDLPAASFAGQQDTYLNVSGRQAILAHVARCWASLFSARAVTYRLQNGFDHRKVSLAVVVQKMVFPQAAGIMFTADPVTFNRKVLAIDAGFGLGEALVSGLVNPDIYRVRAGNVIDSKVAAKKLAVYAAAGGGTQAREIAPEQQNRPALTGAQILQLAAIGRKIEAHFGRPQDIEWCLAAGEFYILQSRPITTLYPIPEAADGENHVYLSVSHQQMMTDPMKPLGLSLFQLTAARPMFPAGGRLFVDVTAELASPARRDAWLNVIGSGDPRIKDALLTILGRGDFIKVLPGEAQAPGPGQGNRALPPAVRPPQIADDPAIVADLIAAIEASLETLKQDIQAQSGPELVDFILADIPQLKKVVFDPQSTAVIMAAFNASAWLNEKMAEWLGEKNAADTLSQSVPNNVTSEMGLALLDVADVIRPYPAVVAYLQDVKEDDFLAGLLNFAGGRESRDAIEAYLDRYGMRCVGEIDITKTRWREKPAILVPMILSNIKNFAPGAGRRKFEQGRQEALQKEQELLDRLRQLPDGVGKAEETQRMISRLRNFTGYREYPKYGIVSRYFVYKQALLKEAARLVHAKVIHDKEDIYYLTFAELREVVATQQLDYQLIVRRKEAYALYNRLAPPRVMTSDGEIVAGAYKRDNIPPAALEGLPVSTGVIEGRARVILNMEEADLEDGDILVTAYTDPSWTPLFVSIKGLVTEVGGLMTHGAVIAREYGLPAVVGVDNATRLIADGRRIRVNGTDGYVEML